MFEKRVYKRMKSFIEGKTSYVRHIIALGKGIQRNTRYLTLSVEFNQIWMQGPFLVVFSLTWKKLLIQLITVSLFINWTFTVFGGLSMFGLDLIYKIEQKLQITIKGCPTSLLLRMGFPKSSVLEPLLFLLYVNDTCIYSSSNKLNFYLFCRRRHNFELNNVFQWLTSNKLTLNQNKSNFVIFRLYQKRLSFVPTICILDHQTNTLTYVECKECVKFLGVLIDYIHRTLVNIYNFLISPYLCHGSTV